MVIYYVIVSYVLHERATNIATYVVANFEGSGEKRATGKDVKTNRTRKTGLMLLNLIFHLGIRSLYKSIRRTCTVQQIFVTVNI